MPESTIKYTERVIENSISLIKRGVPFEEFPAEIKILFKRWTIAHDIQYDFNHKGSRFILNLYKARFPELNDTQARLDLRASQQVFSRINIQTRSFKRMLAIERIEKAIADANARGDHKLEPLFESVLFKYLDPANDEPERPDWEEFIKQAQVVVVFDPTLAGVEPVSKEETEALWRKLALDKGIDDAQFEDVLKEEPEPEPQKSIQKIEDENA